MRSTRWFWSTCSTGLPPASQYPMTTRILVENFGCYSDRGFTRSFATFNFERQGDKTKLFRVDKIMDDFFFNIIK
jgi:hypothetical protein